MSEGLPRTEFDLYRGGTDRRLDRLENRLDHLDDALETALRELAKQREDDQKATAGALTTALEKLAQSRDRSWQRTFGITAALCGLVAAWYEILSHIR